MLLVDSGYSYSFKGGTKYNSGLGRVNSKLSGMPEANELNAPTCPAFQFK